MRAAACARGRSDMLVLILARWGAVSAVLLADVLENVALPLVAGDGGISRSV